MAEEVGGGSLLEVAMWGVVSSSFFLPDHSSCLSGLLV